MYALSHGFNLGFERCICNRGKGAGKGREEGKGREGEVMATSQYGEGIGGKLEKTMKNDK